MNALWELLNQPVVRRVGWVLLHSLWQGALAAAVFGLLRATMRRRSANARYLAGCGALFLLATAPLLTFLCLPATGVGAMHVSSIPFVRGDVASSNLANVHLIGVRDGGSWLLRNTLESIERLIPLLGAAWLIGFLVFSFRLAQGWWRVKLLRRQETVPLDSVWLEALNDLKCRLNISRPVQLMKSGLVEVPTVIGWLSPVILLPASSLIGLSPAQFEAILAHELAHVCRHDYLVNVFQVVVETLMFYHPAVWWISRCIREEREHCCDDLAVRVCQDRVVYASALATLEELRAVSPQLAFAANGGPLLKRIRRLVGAAADDRPASGREIGGLALLAIGLALVITGICLAVGQPLYRAVTRMKIERDTVAQLTSNDGKVSLSIGDPYFLQTEFAVVQSDRILSQVASELNLSQEWGNRYASGKPMKTDEMISLLRSRLDLRPIQNTSLIEIGVLSDRPVEAAMVANAAATAYKRYRLDQRTLASRGGIDALEERFKKQEKEIEEAQRKVSDLREQLQIPDAEVNADGPELLLSANTLRKAESQRMESMTDLIAQQAMLLQLKKLSPAGLVQALLTTVPDDTLLVTLVESLNTTEQALIIKKNDFGPRNTEIIKLNSQLDDLKDKIKKRVEGILIALEARVEALRKSLAALEANVNSATTNDIVKAHQSQPYYDAKRRLEQLQRYGQILTMKIVSEKIDAELPRSATAEIIDFAQPPIHSISPNRYRGLGCSALGLLLAVVGLVMVKAAARLRPTPKPV